MKLKRFFSSQRQSVETKTTLSCGFISSARNQVLYSLVIIMFALLCCGIKAMAAPNHGDQICVSNTVQTNVPFGTTPIAGTYTYDTRTGFFRKLPVVVKYNGGFWHITGTNFADLHEYTSNAAANSVAGIVSAAWTAAGLYTAPLPMVTAGPGAPEMDVQGNGQSISDGDTTPATDDHTDFGSVDVTSGTIERTFTFWNTGTVYLNLTGTPRVAISGADAVDFTVTQQPTSPVTAGGTINFKVQFDPSTAGLRQATVSIDNNDADENPYTFDIQGTGGTAGYGSTPASGSTISMTAVEDTDATFSLTVSETGNAALNVTGITVTGTDAGKFSVSLTDFNIADGGAAQDVTVTCDGSAAGVFDATLNVAHNADGSPATYPLSCTIDASAPPVASVMYVTSTAGSYTAGTVIAIAVRFSQTVWVSGTPQLVLNIGEIPMMAYYSTGSGTDTLTFQYTIAAGDIVSNLEYWSVWALQLNGGRIWDNMDNDVIRDLPEPGTPGSLSGDIVLSLDTDYPVFRLYSHITKKHLFTMDENEKETLLTLTDADGATIWRDEGIAYYAFHQNQYKAASRQQRNALQAVHRFYSETLQTHLFTVDENEKEHLNANAADVWRYEGPAFYVPASEQDDTVPVYRFYSESLAVHLYTTDENEKNTLIETAGDVWRFEGVAYYAYP
ncbi:choice-of-anchor D domain-containing protein [Desulfococcaceae bacterium HSG9]|nr:choice-of-anchor D domain-containing protein [Desulfococcaceae bacterium HSG9]